MQSNQQNKKTVKSTKQPLKSTKQPMKSTKQHMHSVEQPMKSLILFEMSLISNNYGIRLSINTFYIWWKTN